MVKQVCGLSEATAVVIAIVLLVLGKYILSFYVTDEAVVYAMGNLKVYSAGLLLMYPMYALRQTVQALGNVRIPLLAAVLQLVMRILTASFLPLLIGSSGIYYTSFAAWAVSLILTMGRTGKSFPGWRHAVTRGWKCILRILYVY